MRRPIVALCIGLAALAISLLGVSSAFANVEADPAQPEYGHCRKHTTATFQFTDKACNSESAGGNTGSWEWRPGCQGKGCNFTATTGIATLRLPAAGAKTVCMKSKAPGTATSAYVAKSPGAEFEECSSMGEECHSVNPLAGAGKVTTLELIIETGYISDADPTETVGEDIKGTVANGGKLAEFQCGGTPPTFIAKGSLICKVTPIDVRQTKAGHELKCEESGGKQVPEKFEGGVKDTLITEFGAAGEFDSTQESTIKTPTNLELRA